MSLEHIDQHFAVACQAVERMDVPVIKSIARHDLRELRHTPATEITTEMRQTIAAYGALAVEAATSSTWYNNDWPAPRAA